MYGYFYVFRINLEKLKIALFLCYKLWWRKTISTVLVLNTLIGILWQPLVYVDFKLRQDYIAKVLCIKKDEPITVCGGSCVLDDRLMRMDSPVNQNSQPIHQNRILEINFYLEESGINIPQSYAVELVKNSTLQQVLSICRGYALDVFNPPRV